MKKNLALVLGITAGVALVGTMTERADALPSFARQYKTECKTCHTIYPERNEFGEAFERNGFIWPGKKAAPKVEKENEAFGISGIPAEIPLSFFARVTNSYNGEQTNDGKGPVLDFGNTATLELFMAGNFKERMGFMAEAGFGTDSADSKVGKVWLKYKDPFDVPMYAKLGTFDPELGLFKSNQRGANSGFKYMGINVGSNPFKPSSSKGGLELSKIFGNNVYGATGLLNGKIDDNANNNQTEGYGSLAVRFMGTDFRGNEPAVSLSSDSITDFLTLTVAGYGITGSANKGTDDFYRAGVDGEVIYKALRVRLGTSFGEDDLAAAPSGDLQSKDITTYQSMVEYMIGSDVMLSAGYEIDTIDELKATDNKYPNQILTLGATYAFYQNVKVGAFYTHDKTTNGSGSNTADGNNDAFQLNAYFAF